MSVADPTNSNIITASSGATTARDHRAVSNVDQNASEAAKLIQMGYVNRCVLCMFRCVSYIYLQRACACACVICCA